MNRRDFIKTGLAAAAISMLPGRAPLGALGGSRASAAEAAATPGGDGKVARRPFAGGKLTIPLLGFGMMRLPMKDGKIDYEHGKKMVARAFEAGVNYFDTAFMYHGGASEKFVGDVLSQYPRDSYYLASKLPVWMAKDAADMNRIFEEQRKRCQTEYFDFYMLHALDRGKWDTVKRYKAYEFVMKKKEEGKVRHVGFSFHDKPEVLKEIAAAHPWEFAQIQLNYLDWENYRSREQYEILAAAKIPIIVMEPLRGGALAKLNPAAVNLLKSRAPQASPASWAMRYVGSFPEVITILSGMSADWQLEDNIKTFSPFVPLSDADRDVLATALAAYRKQLAVPCTGCAYCLPCPVGVAIPTVFAQYNQLKVSGKRAELDRAFAAMPPSARPEACVKCNKCVKACPQHIDVPAELEKIVKALGPAKA